MVSGRSRPLLRDSSLKEDLTGFVALVVPYRVEKLLEGCCLLLVNIVFAVRRQGKEGTGEKERKRQQR